MCYVHVYMNICVIMYIAITTRYVTHPTCACALLITQSHLSVFSSNVLGLAFLLVFSTLLLVQFVAMAYHRISTAIHIIATATNTSTTDSRYSVCDGACFIVQCWGYIFSFKVIQCPSAINRCWGYIQL